LSGSSSAALILKRIAFTVAYFVEYIVSDRVKYLILCSLFPVPFIVAFIGASNSLKSSLFRFKISDSDSCGLIEDENYILWVCNNIPKKERICHKFNKLNIKAPIDIKEILKRMKTKE